MTSNLTIFALSSGAPPAGIAVIRVSGPAAFAALTALAGTLPPARTARLRSLRDDKGALLDRALILCFPGPASATGEDLVELHCHGGRAVVAAVLAALGRQSNVRPAQPGEFTRRALSNGRIDLAEARGLADLLSAETERQRVAAISAAEGVVSRQVRAWLTRLSALAARVEAQLDFADEDDVAGDDVALVAVIDGMRTLADEWRSVIAEPPVERLRDGLLVVLAGPPNSGKSTLINLLSQRDVAIVSDIAGTTRDRIEVALVRDGLAYRLTDTAGLTETVDPIERIGVTRAGDAIEQADILLWLGDDAPPRADAVRVHARADQAGRVEMPADRDVAVRQDQPTTIGSLWSIIHARADALVPRIDAISFRAQERAALQQAFEAIATPEDDPVLVAEQLRVASRLLATILGVDATEAMLDSLFGQFCVGK
ncbi:tRNA uridine-5-carboxymethylaminomethyl(34) synthesis GTPase MnmE [Sphingomonas sp. XXL09]|uniref:tRNA uridine-5-carboxymethylaminomethyl(34) synthesis GTPase MnmE n=1 Tax=Sphingomonas sp. XXL09 TaxID=3457787 RepID=UPI00406BD3BC